MYRGVISLTPTEIGILQEIVTQPSFSASLLKGRIRHDGESAHPTAVQLSEEEAELLLDHLPLPTKVTTPEHLALRSKITQFLLSLRT